MDNSFIDFKNFKWVKHTFNSSQNINKSILESDYNTIHKYKEYSQKDLSRICELELIKKIWIEVTNLDEFTFDNFLKKLSFNSIERILQIIDLYKSLCKPCLNLIKAFANEDSFILLKFIFLAVSPGR